MRGATNTELLPGLGKGISIHAPHAGSDGDSAIDAYNNLVISIHAPHAGSDHN